MQVKVARVYFSEGQKQLKPLMDYLQNDVEVKGVTVFRGIEGFGESGVKQSTSILDLSFDLPIVIEFFDAPNVVDDILERLKVMVKPGHIITWLAENVERT